MFDNVMIGDDGREGGRDALELAKQLASPDAHLTLAYVQVLTLKPPPLKPPPDFGLTSEGMNIAVNQLASHGWGALHDPLTAQG